MMMANYLLMIYVTLEQERAVRDLFKLRDWKYKRKGLERCDSPTEDLQTITNKETENIDQSDISTIHRVKANTSIQRTRRGVKSTISAPTDIKKKKEVYTSILGDTKVKVRHIKQDTTAETSPTDYESEKDQNDKLETNKSDEFVQDDLCKYSSSENGERLEIYMFKDPSGNKVKKTKSFASVFDSKDTPFNSTKSESDYLRRSRRKKQPVKYSKMVHSDFPVLSDNELIVLKSSVIAGTDSKENNDLMLPNKVQNVTTKPMSGEIETQLSTTVLDTKNLNTSPGAQILKENVEGDSKIENGNKNRNLKGRLKRKTAEEVIECIRSIEDNFPEDVKIKVKDLLKSFGNKNGVEKLKCLFCARVFSTRFNFITHVDKHTKKAFDCPECGKRFGNHRNLNAHRYTRANLRQFMCELCKFETTTACLLRIHNKREHHSSIFFQCHVCPRLLRTKSYLNVHLKQAHGIYEGKYECPICGQKCKRPKLFQKHLKEHDNETGRQCVVCQKIFSSKAHLRSHMRIHAERKHVCKQCGKCFTTITKLTGHERTHSGYKPFSCTFCDYKTAQAGNLKSHMKIHQRDGESKSAFPKSKTKTPKIKLETDKVSVVENNSGIAYEPANQQQDWYTSGYADQNLMYSDTGNQVYPANIAYQGSKNTNVKEENTQIQKDFYNLDLEQKRDEYNLCYNELESYQNYYNSYMSDNQYYDTSRTSYTLQDDAVVGNTSKQEVSNNENNIKPYTASKLFEVYEKNTSQTLQQQQQSHHQQHYDNQQGVKQSQQQQQHVQAQTVIAQTIYQQGTDSKVTKQEMTLKDAQQPQSHHQQQHFDQQSYKQQLNQQVQYQPETYNQLYSQSTSQTGVFHPSSDPSHHQSLYSSEVYTGMGKHLNEIRQTLDLTYGPAETETYDTKSGKSDFTNPNDRIYLGPSGSQQPYKYVFEVPQNLPYIKQPIQPEYDLNAQTPYPDLEQTHYVVKPDHSKGS